MPRSVQLPLWEDDNFWELEEGKFSKILLPFLTKLFINGAAAGLAGIGVAFDAAHWNNFAEQFARTYSYELVKQINDTSRKYLQQTVGDWIQSGKPLDELIAAIDASGMFGPVRSQMIAVTETTRVFAEGNLEGWRESGVVKGKRWMTAVDELVCVICAPLNNRVVGLDEAFGDEFSDPPAHVNCRCAIQPVLSE